MNDRGITSRAAFLRAIRDLKRGDPRIDQIAQFFHLSRDTADVAVIVDDTPPRRVRPPARVAPSFLPSPLRPVPLPIAVALRPTDPPGTGSRPGPPLPPYAGHWRGRPSVIPPHRSLASWRALQRVIHRLLREPIPSSEVDLEPAVRRIAEAEVLERVPKKKIKSWPSRLAIVWDRSAHLVPFWFDQELLTRALQQTLPHTEVIPFVYRDAERSIWRVEHPAAGAIDLETLDMPVLLLGDLGALASDSGTIDFFQALGYRLGRRRALALLPCHPERVDARLKPLWRLGEWECERSATSSSHEMRQRARELLTLASPAIRLEPGLLREIRLRALPEADASVEVAAWRDPALAHGSSVAARFRPEAQIKLREAFEKLERDRRREVIDAIKSWRSEVHEAVWYVEVLNLDPDTRRALPEHDLEDARGYFEVVRASIDTSRGFQRAMRAYLTEAGEHSKRAFDFSAFNAAVNFATRQSTGRGDLPRDPFGAGPIAVAIKGDRLQLASARDVTGSVLAILPSDDGEVVLREDDGWAEIWGEEGQPEWVSRLDKDQHGKWVEFSLGDVTQCLRWIPPGRFMMGSPETEDGRWEDEGPQTEITFARGFWLFDTAVTQALWTAVMGENPSAFPGDERPVENVSWDDAQRFITRLNERIPGLGLSLPSEAMWEYACRAGTETPYFFGTEPHPEDIHFGHSARDQDTGTAEVKAKPPNEWGLYQMHGNVDEWCADFWWSSHEGAKPDGSPRQSSDPDGVRYRVLRGGSWDDPARYVRSAYRSVDDPGGRSDDLGFRCARGQVSSSGPEGRAAGTAAARAAEPRAAGGETESCRVIAGGPVQQLPLPKVPFVLKTDRAELTVGRLVKSELPWASAAGRDRFGLWSEFTHEGVTQRMRWIPPGRFTMGSPEDEPGRFDSEGPQTEITFAEGFWLFDTPVTQALWTAVMDKNPSRFVSPTRPVELVSWEDAQDFIGKLNERHDGLALSLPGEAMWEYACRAGTTSATYAGPIEILGENNAPVLDAIAWYGGNSGVDFDLPDGSDSSGWNEKQYRHERAGSRPVKGKRPNPWGLYDMLGNVWEWCQDGWNGSLAGIDESGRAREKTDGERYRVIRGGSWHGTARNVRSAYRSRLAPGYRAINLGFRCARGQVSSSGPEGRAAGTAAARAAQEDGSGGSVPDTKSPSTRKQR